MSIFTTLTNYDVLPVYIFVSPNKYDKRAKINENYQKKKIGNIIKVNNFFFKFIKLYFYKILPNFFERNTGKVRDTETENLGNLLKTYHGIS